MTVQEKLLALAEEAIRLSQATGNRRERENQIARAGAFVKSAAIAAMGDTR